jgi:hypothetical protein
VSVCFLGLGEDAWRASPFLSLSLSLAHTQVVINSQLYANLEYRRATDTFHQWQDARHVYGLHFGSKEEASIFGTAMDKALANVNNHGKPAAHVSACPLVSVCLSICLCLCLSVCLPLSVCLSVCLRCLVVTDPIGGCGRDGGHCCSCQGQGWRRMHNHSFTHTHTLSHTLTHIRSHRLWPSCLSLSLTHSYSHMHIHSHS